MLNQKILLHKKKKPTGKSDAENTKSEGTPEFFLDREKESEEKK